MKKLSFLAGLGIGFLLGSRSGRGPYQNLENKVRELLGQEQVQDTIGHIKGAAQDQLSEAADRVTQRVAEAADHLGNSGNSDTRPDVKSPMATQSTRDGGTASSRS
jgi:hypothetical protein